MGWSVSPFFSIAFGADCRLLDPWDLSRPYIRLLPLACPRPTRRTLAQLHRDLFRSRYSGADLRRLAGDPNRRECRRRRRAGWREAVGLAALSPNYSEA